MWKSITLLMGTLCLAHASTASLSTVSSVYGSISPTTTTSTAFLSTVSSVYGSISPTTTSAATSALPTVVPTPSPTMLPTQPSNYTYIIPDSTNNNIPCLRMVVDVGLSFAYFDTSNHIRNIWFRFQNNSIGELSVSNTSFCSGTIKKPLANLTLEYQLNNENLPFFVTFSFKGDRTPGNQLWTFNNLTVNFTYDDRLFVNNTNQSFKNGDKYYAYSIDSLFDDSNSRVELTRAYRCISNQTIGGFKGSGLGIMTNVSVWVRDLTVQAFNFTEINGTFATGQAVRTCPMDASHGGNEVVPIAVGAALAVLVALVLVAYLIGKIRNKKKNSYEAL